MPDPGKKAVPPTLNTVVDAFGSVLACVEVAVKYEARTKLAKLPIPNTSSGYAADVVPIARLPELVIRARSVPAVENARVPLEGKNMPVAPSKEEEYPGVAALALLE